MIGSVNIQITKKVERRLNRKFNSEEKRKLNQETALTWVSSTTICAKIDSDEN